MNLKLEILNLNELNKYIFELLKIFSQYLRIHALL